MDEHEPVALLHEANDTKRHSNVVRLLGFITTRPQINIHKRINLCAHKRMINYNLINLLKTNPAFLYK